LNEETIKATAVALSSLTTTGMLIVAVTVIIFALAKFGVFAKILDREIKKRRISTGVDEKVIKDIFSNIDTILSNDKNQEERLIAIEKTNKRINSRIDDFEKSQFEYRMEAYKRAVFDNRLLLTDRMSAAIKFLLNGGNSEAKEYILNVLAHEDLETWNGLCKALNAMKYWQHGTTEKKKGRRTRATAK
jgi:hypothetical protein